MGRHFAVIDTETTYSDQVMSIGIVIADRDSFLAAESRYYIFPEEEHKPSMFGYALYAGEDQPLRLEREAAMREIDLLLKAWDADTLFAYNASFDRRHLPELSGYDWKDIMKLAAYRQYNPAISPDLPCCGSGRLRSGYGVASVLRMLSGEESYEEVHNALCDARDELRIMRLLGHPLEAYPLL